MASRDTGSCSTYTYRLGGFAFPIEVDSWPSYVALGVNKKLCIPAPTNSHTLIMNPSVGDPSLDVDGGYVLSANLANVEKDMLAARTMLGWGSANVATQSSAAQCASIGSLAAARRSCAVGIAYTDPNRDPTGSLSQRGVLMSIAQNTSNPTNHRIPFGRVDGWGLYGTASKSMESYASAVLQKHTTVSVPTSPTGLDAWNAQNSTLDFSLSKFSPLPITSGGSNLKANAERGVGATKSTPINKLNMAPFDYAESGSKGPWDWSINVAPGNLFALTLPALATMQSPLYGSGKARWFFHDPNKPDAATVPLMDVSSIFQGSLYVMTGQLSGPSWSDPQLTHAHISQLKLKYGDLHSEEGGTQLYVDHAGQIPLSNPPAQDEPEARIHAALRLARPPENMAASANAMCALTNTGGAVSCWGRDWGAVFGTGQTADIDATTPVATNITLGAKELAAGEGHFCALMTDGTIKCWGVEQDHLFDANTLQTCTGAGGTTPCRTTPTSLPLTSKAVQITAAKYNTCALLDNGNIECLGRGCWEQPNHRCITTPQDLGGNPRMIAAATAAVCAVTNGGTIKCWNLGDPNVDGINVNSRGILGTGSSSSDAVYTPTATDQFFRAEIIHGGDQKFCATARTGALMCWGDRYGLGRDSIQNALSPAIISPATDGFIRSFSLSKNGGCALKEGGSVWCWTHESNSYGQAGIGSATSYVFKEPTKASKLSNTDVVSVHRAAYTTCARLRTGEVKCWGASPGDGTAYGPHTSPVLVSGDIRTSLVVSQGSVLAHFNGADSSGLAGHVTPILYSMQAQVNSGGTSEALLVTYDPAAVGAAMFIEQYKRHRKACENTTNTTVTEMDAFRDDDNVKIWVCSDATNKAGYLEYLDNTLKASRKYLFGHEDACIGTKDDDGLPCAAIVEPEMHAPYTFVTLLFDGYYDRMKTAIDSYRNSILGTSGSRLQKTLQLAMARQFTANDAIVTSSVMREGAYGLSCTANEGFIGMAATSTSCGNDVCEVGESRATCPADCGDLPVTSAVDEADPTTEIAVEGNVTKNDFLVFGPYDYIPDATNKMKVTTTSSSSVQLHVYTSEPASPGAAGYACRPSASTSNTCNITATENRQVWVHVKGTYAATVKLVVSRVTAPALPTVFADNNYAGWKLTLGEGSYVLPSAYDNAISSVKVPAGWEVRIFDNADFTGTATSFTADNAGFSSTYNNKTSSIRVTRSRPAAWVP